MSKEFVLLFRASLENQAQAMGAPERAERSMQAWLSWVRELEQSGVLASPGQPLAPSGKVVRGASVTDGPYAEAKDLVLGFNIIRARDLDHAAEIASRCPIAMNGGVVEVRPVGSIGGGEL